MIATLHLNPVLSWLAISLGLLLLYVIVFRPWPREVSEAGSSAAVVDTASPVEQAGSLPASTSTVAPEMVGERQGRQPASLTSFTRLGGGETWGPDRSPSKPVRGLPASSADSPQLSTPDGEAA